MADRPTDTADWTASGNISTPVGARKTSGWLGATATTPGDKPPAQEFNWFWALVSTWLAWLLSRGAQRIETWEAATGWVTDEASDTPAVIDLEAFVANDYNPAIEPFSANDMTTVVVPTLTNLTGIATDGRALWVAGDDGAGNGGVLQLSLIGATWDATWKTYTGDLVTAISSSGRHVGVGRAIGAADGAYIYKAAGGDESTASRMAIGNPVTAIDLLGAGVLLVDNAGGYVLGDDMTGTTFSGNRGAANNACAGYGILGMVAGAHDGANVATVYNLTDGVGAYSFNRTANAINDVCTDGDFWFVGGAVDTVASLECREMVAGVLVWSIGGMGGAGVSRVAVDDRYVYAVGGSILYIRDKRNGALIQSHTFASAPDGVASDGRRVYIIEGTNLQILERNELPRALVYIDPDDAAGVDTLLTNNRKPYHGLILPGGIR